MSTERRGFGVEVSVGIFILAAAFFLAVMVFMTGGYRLRGEAWTIQLAFNDVSGLKPQAPVLVAGTQLGSVSDITFHEPRTMPSGETYCVTVTLALPKSVVLHWGTRAYVSSAGFLGEVFVGLDPGREPEALADGALLRGREMTTFAKVQETADETLRTVNDVVGGFRGIAGFAGDSSVQMDLRMAIANARLITEKVDRLVEENRSVLARSVERIDRVTAGAETSIFATTENLRIFSEDLRTSTADVRGDLRRLSERLDYIAKVGGDTMLQAMENARQATQTAREGVERVSEDLTSSSNAVRRITLQRETDVQQVITNLSAASVQLRETARIAKEIADSVSAGHGMVGAMVRSDTAASDFRAIMSNSARASESLEKLIEDIRRNPRNFLKFSFF